MFSRYLTALGLVASVLSLTAEAQTPVATSNLLINRADGSDGSDQTQIFRADPAENQGELRLQIGDDGSDDVFNIGYRYWASGEWISNFKFRADGNSSFRGNLGLGVDNPAYKLDVNGKAQFRGKLLFSDVQDPGNDDVLPGEFSIRRRVGDGRTTSGIVVQLGTRNNSQDYFGVTSKMPGSDGYKMPIMSWYVDGEGNQTGNSARFKELNLDDFGGGVSGKIPLLRAGALPVSIGRSDATASNVEMRAQIGNSASAAQKFVVGVYNSAGDWTPGFSAGTNGDVDAKGNLTVVGKITSQGDITTTSKVTAGTDVVANGKVSAIGDISTNGNVFARGRLYVGTTGWSISAPDYVFDEGYSLLPIDSVISYVKTNKHLPGVPSAKEMETAEKQDLVEMNMLLLKKMEEMTLYIGELNARVSKMEKNADREVK